MYVERSISLYTRNRTGVSRESDPAGVISLSFAARLPKSLRRTFSADSATKDLSFALALTVVSHIGPVSMLETRASLGY